MLIPEEPCTSCEGHPMVTGIFVPGGGRPPYRDVWLFKCDCGHTWDKLPSQIQNEDEPEQAFCKSCGLEILEFGSDAGQHRMAGSTTQPDDPGTRRIEWADLCAECAAKQDERERRGI